ncbi:MAG: hypothetical protein ACXWNK_18220 [Vulcanimicrobiaceae bacterium]
MSVRAARNAAAFAALALLVTACAGTGGSNSALPRVGTSPMEHVQFTMHWPAASSLAKLRRPTFVSPSTMSLVIEVNSDSSLTSVVNNPSTNGQPTNSTLAIDAPAGNDTFYFTLWDQKDGGGNQLGQVAVSQTIAGGKVNTLAATIDGVLAKVGIAAAGNQPFLEQATDATGASNFTLVGDQPATFTITPLDADGNIIVAPGTVPSISLTASDPSITVTQSNKNANQYTVQETTPTPHGVHPSLVAVGTDGNGFTATTHYPITPAAAVYVAYENGGTGSVLAFDQNGNAIKTAGSFAGVVDPKGIAYDADDHLLFVADSGAGKILAFDENGNASTTVTPIAYAGASAVAYDAQNKQLYVASGSNNSVGVFTAAGAPVTTAGTFSGVSNPNGVAISFGNADSTGNIYVTSATAGTAPLAFKDDGTATTPSLNQDSTYASGGIAYDVNQNAFWVSASAVSAYQLVQYSSFGFGSQTYSTGLNAPAGVAFNPLNNEIYVANAGANAIAAFTNTDPFNQDTAVNITASGATKPTGIAIVY